MWHRRVDISSAIKNVDFLETKNDEAGYAFPWISIESCKCHIAFTYFLTQDMYTFLSLPAPRWYRFPKFWLLTHALHALMLISNESSDISNANIYLRK